MIWLFRAKPKTENPRLTALKEYWATKDADAPSPPKIQIPEPPAKAEESTMATAPVTPAPASTENGFERFIDKLESFVSAELPTVIDGAVAAEPILALTPIGPEYALVVTAIAAAENASAAFRSKTGVSLTGTQKMSLVVQATAPTLTATLSAAGVTDTAIPTAIDQFAQNVYNFQTGPAATPAPVQDPTPEADPTPTEASTPAPAE